MTRAITWGFVAAAGYDILGILTFGECDVL